jgi:DNA-binding transcriptional LysR family regulator
MENPVPASGYRTFVKIVETGSLAATAKELHLSPSAVSKHLSALEDRLGAKLIQRSTRSMQVTDVGERFFHRCLDILAAADNAESEVRDSSGELGGKLKITLPQAMASAGFSLLLQSFRKAYPRISLDIKVSNTAQNLIEQNIDVAFRAGTLKDSRLVAIELFSTRIVMCGSPDYIQREGEPENLQQLRDHTLLVPAYYYLRSAEEQIDQDELSSPFDNHLICDELPMLVELAKSGAGIAMLWESYTQAEVEAGGLVQFESLIKHELRPLNMIYLSREYMPRRLTLFLEHIRRGYGKPALSPPNSDQPQSTGGG